MSGNAWRMAEIVVALIAIGIGAYAYTQHNAVTDLTSQLAAATADAKQAHADADALRDQLSATKSEASNEQQQLETTAAKLAAETRPDLPINISFRKGLLSAGFVGVFHNTSSKELEFTLDLESPATGRHVRRAIVMNPNGILEIGAQQGWPFAPGQQITLSNPAYRPVVRTVGG